jgi:hypothetical protein
MKNIFFAAFLISNFAFASETATSSTEAPKESSNKMTTRDAKKSCKDEGKKGQDLIQCMKDKKNEK